MTSVATLPALRTMSSDETTLPGDENQHARKPGRPQAKQRDLALSRNLKRLRKLRGYRQQEALDRALGVSKGSTAVWEQGIRPPTHPQLRLIAAHFGITIDQLLDPDADFSKPAADIEPSFAVWQRFLCELLAHYPGRIEIQEINFFAPHGTANVAHGTPPDEPAV